MPQPEIEPTTLRTVAECSTFTLRQPFEGRPAESHKIQQKLYQLLYILKRNYHLAHSYPILRYQNHR